MLIPVFCYLYEIRLFAICRKAQALLCSNRLPTTDYIHDYFSWSVNIYEPALKDTWELCFQCSGTYQILQHICQNCWNFDQNILKELTLLLHWVKKLSTKSWRIRFFHWFFHWQQLQFCYRHCPRPKNLSKFQLH